MARTCVFPRLLSSKGGSILEKRSRHIDNHSLPPALRLLLLPLFIYIYIYIIVVYCFSAIWNNSNIYIFITLQLSDFMNNLANVDGIWIDMNECANFCDGFCSEDQATKYEPDSTSSSTSRPLDPRNPPYHINNRCSKQPLSTRTLPVEATQHGGILQYNAHSLYGELHFLTY